MPAPPMKAGADDSRPHKSSATPKLTVPQVAAFAAFGLFVFLAAFSDKTVTPAEYGKVEHLCIFLIAALLPSDALIRYGRSRFMRSVSDQHRGAENFPAQMQVTTLAQMLALAAFVVVCIAAVIKVFGPSDFTKIVDTASFLIAALLPSEAVVRFGRANWLSGVAPGEITPEALKRI